MLQSFRNAKAKNLGFELITRFGQPNIALVGRLEWYQIMPYISTIVLLDESIPHNFPMPHTDYVYSTTNIKITPDQASALVQVSGSIIIDQLKGQVTARCGALIKNQVTLGFVYDFVNGRIKNIRSVADLKNEYADRIENNQISTSGRYNPVFGVEADRPTQTGSISLIDQMKLLGEQTRRIFN